MIKNEKKARIGKRLFTITFVLCTMVILMTLMALSINATSIDRQLGSAWNSATNTCTPDGIEGSILVRPNRNGSMDGTIGSGTGTTLIKCINGTYTTTYNYCVPAKLTWWIGNTQYVSGSNSGGYWNASTVGNTVVVLGDGEVEYGGDWGPYDSSKTQKQWVTITWKEEYKGEPIELIWKLSYIRGTGYVNHEWRVDNKSIAISEDVPAVPITDQIMLYYGGHHKLGGGNHDANQLYGGYSLFNGVSSAIYTWRDNTLGMFMLRSDGAVTPNSYYADGINDGTSGSSHPPLSNSTISDKVETRDVFPGNLSTPSYDTERSAHTCNYFQWTSHATQTNIAPGGTWKVQGTEGAVAPGDISVIPPLGKTVPDNVVVAYEFEVQNMDDGSTTIDLSYELNNEAKALGWTAEIYGETRIILDEKFDSEKVIIHLTIPNTAETGDIGKVSLIATPIDTDNDDTPIDGAMRRDSVVTEINTDAPAITEVSHSRLTKSEIDIKVTYRNLAEKNETIIDIYDQRDGRLIWQTGNAFEDATFLDGDYDKIATGESVIGIPVDMLEANVEYIVKVQVDGIEGFHFQYKFTMVGDNASGIVWRDMNERNGTRESYEGALNIPFILEEQRNGVVGKYIFATSSIKGGTISFKEETSGNHSTIKHSHYPLSSYTFRPDLDNFPIEYAVKEIKIFINGDPYETYKNTPEFDEIFVGDFNIDGVSKIEYAFKADQTAQISFVVEIDYSTIIHVYPYAGERNVNNLVDIENINVTYTPPGLSDPLFDDSGALQVADDELPYESRIIAYSNTSISVTAPEGFRMADRSRTYTRDNINNLAPYNNTKKPHDEWFELIAGDVEITGIREKGTSTPTLAEPTDPVSERVQVTIDQSWAWLTTQLDFKAWDNKAAPIIDPKRSNYVWTVEEGNNIIHSIDASTGEIIFNGKIGKAVVRVALESNRALYHEINIYVDSSPITYDTIYIAYPDDIDTPIDQIALVRNGEPTKVVVVGIVNGTDERKPIRNNVATIEQLSPNKLEIIPTSGHLFTFNLTGKISGITKIHATCESVPDSEPVDVLITDLSLIYAQGIEITPDPINIGKDGTKNVKYTLKFANAVNDVELTSDFVNATLYNVDTIATLSNDKMTLTYASTGTDTLIASLTLDPNINDTARVNCEDALPHVEIGDDDGELTLQEVTDTLGLIAQEGTAEYIAFFDKNDNGEYDEGIDILLPYGTQDAIFETTNGRFSMEKTGVDDKNVLVTGNIVGGDKLTVTYTYNGKQHTASTDIVIFTEGYEYEGIEVDPEIIVMHSKETISFVVRGVFFNTTTQLKEKRILPKSMYTGSIPEGDDVVSIVTGTENNVQAEDMDLVAEAVYRATLNADNSIRAEADILVIPEGAELKVGPHPLWIEINTTRDVTYTLITAKGDTISYPNTTHPNGKGLLHYVDTTIPKTAVALFDNDDVTKVKGISVDKALLSAFLYGKPNDKKEVTIYVWDYCTKDPDEPGVNKPGIIWQPSTLDIDSGDMRGSNLYLRDKDGNQKALVNLEHLLDIGGNDNNIATIPENPTGTILNVTAKPLTSNKSTKVTAKSPAGEADLIINVKSNIKVYGIEAIPKIVEVWPDKRGEVEIKITDTGVKLTTAQLESTRIILDDDNIIDIDNGKLIITQDPDNLDDLGSVNVMTVNYEGRLTTVYIINHKYDDPEIEYIRSLVLDPDPVVVVKDGDPGSVHVKLQLRKKTTGELVNDIILPPEIITWTTNTALPGRITISADTDDHDDYIDVYGIRQGAQTYKVEYKVETTTLSVNGSAFVYAENPDIQDIEFRFERNPVIMTTNAMESIIGVIEYEDGTTQAIIPQEFPIAISGMASSNENAATVINAIITSKNDISPNSFLPSTVTGTLIGTDLVGSTEVLVYDPDAELTIVSTTDTDVALDLLTIYTSGGDPISDIIQTKLGNDIIDNKYLTYGRSNTNIKIEIEDTESQKVTAELEGKSVISVLLKGTTKSDTADVLILNGIAQYWTVTYDVDGTITSDINIKDNSLYRIKSLIGITPPDGMEFDAWEDEDGNLYEVNQQIRVTKDLNLTATWKSSSGIPFTVTYNANYGDIPPIVANVNQGDTHTVKPSNTFTRPGYRFIEWNTDEDPSSGGTSINPGDPLELSSNLELYAIWEIEYTVTYNANYGDTPEIIDTDKGISTETHIVRPSDTFRRDGFEFKGWNENKNADEGDPDYAPNQTFLYKEDVTLYAIWQENPPEIYTVKYEANGGTSPDGLTTISVPGDEGTSHTVKLSDTFTRDGFTFIGWNENKNADEGDPDYAPGKTFLYEKNVILYAIWQENTETVTVSYHANGGTGDEIEDETKTKGSSFIAKPNGFTNDGFEFKGWNTQADGNGTSYDVGETFIPTKDETLYAMWNEFPDGTTYTVTYDANGGDNEDAMGIVSNLPAGKSYKIEKNLFTKSNHMFMGWTTVAGSDVVLYPDEGTISSLGSSVTLYAIWVTDQPGITYRVDYIANGGSGEQMAPDTDIQPNSQHTLKTNTFIAPTNQQFKEWNTQGDGKGTSYANGATIEKMTESLTLYAIWIDISDGTTYKVTYNANNGIGLVPRDTRAYAPGDEVTVQGQGLISRSGYTFAGWSLNSDGSGTIYQANDPYIINNDTTFYAVWEESTTPTPPAKYKLTVQTTSGGTVNSYVSGYYSQGERINIIATPNKNSSFIKWTSNINGVILSPTLPATTVIMPASDVVVTAQFTSPSSSIPIIIGGGVADGGATGILPIVAEKYKVTYKANGGSGKDYVVSGLASSTIHDVLNVEDTQISYSKHIFTGWNTKADGSGKDYMPGDSILIIEDVILYAQWNTKVELKKNDHITYLNGYTDGTVKPDNAITRAEATSIFYRLLEKQGTVTGGKFSDVKNSEWYAEAINYLASVGIATGYDDGTYAPNKPITRAEFTVMAAKFEDMVASSDNITFSDIPKTHVAYNYINSGVTRGWISGFPDGTFKPDDSITRAQVVKIINAMLDRKVDDAALAKVNNPYSDLDKSHWAYSEIIEASIKHDYTRDANGKEIWK